MKLSAKIVILAALALIVSTVQCAAACTPVASGDPPCHHHKQTPAKDSCAHELVATPAPAFWVAESFAPEAVFVQVTLEVAVADKSEDSIDLSRPDSRPPLILRV